MIRIPNADRVWDNVPGMHEVVPGILRKSQEFSKIVRNSRFAALSRLQRRIIWKSINISSACSLRFPSTWMIPIRPSWMTCFPAPMPSRTFAESALNNSTTPSRQLARCRFSFGKVRVFYRLQSLYFLFNAFFNFIHTDIIYFWVYKVICVPMARFTMPFILSSRFLRQTGQWQSGT